MKTFCCLLLAILCLYSCAFGQEIRVLPNAYVYFGAEKKVKPEALDDLECTISFDEYPEAVVEDYCILLAEQYGLLRSDKEEISGSTSWRDSLPFEHKTYLLDPSTHETVVKIGWLDAHEAMKLLCIYFYGDCRLEAREVWDGDVTPYLYNADDWSVCSTCKGRKKCLYCDGKGYTINFIRSLIPFVDAEEDCTYCRNGECPADCVGGKVRIHE